MRRYLCLLAVLCVLVPRPASAWGPEGHVIVARIAELNLSDIARAQIKALLDGHSMANSRNANWADYIKRSAQYRDKYPNNSAYHYVDISVDTSKYEPEKQCKDGACVIASIERFRKVLADTKADATDRKEALLFLIHLVGDMHQPLHCAQRNDDRGGNLYPVRFLGKTEKDLNLHKVWDGHLVRNILGDLEPWDKAMRMHEAIKKEERETWRKGSVEEWALEANKVAKDVVYKDVPEDKSTASPPVDLDENYVKRARPAVEEQLKKGGIRLAMVLNEALEPDNKPLPLPVEIVAAWKEAGAELGWMRSNDFGSFLLPRDEGMAGKLPAFRFHEGLWKEGVVAKLPDPAVPFALSLPNMQVKDAGLKELAGLKSLQLLDLWDNQVTNAGLKELAALKGLQSLNLGANTGVSDAGLKELAGLRSLQTLELWHTQVTDVGLKELAALNSLHELNLRETKVTDAGLKELAALKSLQSLNLDRTKVTDAGLKELVALQSLQSLDLRQTKVTDAGLKELAALKCLQTLELGGTEVTDAGLKELARLKSLQRLNLGGTKITDAGLKELAAMKSLQSLSLGGTKVTDAGLKELAALKSLQSLGLSHTKVTDAGLKELAGLTSLQTLTLDDTKVTDAGLKELAALKSLQWLTFGNTKVTDAGLKELQKALPDCKISR